MPIGIEEVRKRTAENQAGNMGMTGLGHTFQASKDDGANLAIDLNTGGTSEGEQKQLNKAQSSRRIIQLSTGNKNHI